jgi:hypothetical protein
MVLVNIDFLIAFQLNDCLMFFYPSRIRFSILTGCLLMSTLLFAQSKTLTINKATLLDKIKGGWAGKMIGVTYGAPIEFRAQYATYDDSINWTPKDIRGSMWQDDIYVQLTFMMTMDQFGMDAPAKKYQEMFAKAGYMLWHANVQARKNYYDSIFPPVSGSPEFSDHSDDIDFQIEADYLGFMCPGLPQSAMKLANKIGHIMNYGDGVYGGIFLSTLYTQAYFDNNIPSIINKSLQSIPAQSDYAKIVRDVIQLHKLYPTNWKAAWAQLQNKWGYDHICAAGTNFNIDAKFNGAFIIMGLLYGNGDPMKTMEITTRCGQDADCNPSNAMAVLGVIKGFNQLPASMQDGVNAVGDTLFINTTYSYKTAVQNTYQYALQMIQQNGGKVNGELISWPEQKVTTAPWEDAYPHLVFDKKLSVFDKTNWTSKGDWKMYNETSWDGKSERPQALMSATKGDEITFSFEGTGISIAGNWVKDGGKAAIYVDGKWHRNIDTYFDYAQQEHRNITLWNDFKLKPGKHNVTIQVNGEHHPNSTSSKVYITEAVVYKTAPKKSSVYTFPRN